MTDPRPFTPFTVSLAGAEGAVRDSLAEVMVCLEPLGLSTDDAGTVELVLAEALNNVVEHALANTSEHTTIEIRGSHNATTGLHLTVVDEGAPMPTGKAPVPRAPEINVEFDNIPEGGFGWFMIHTLATDVQYARVDDSNHLSLHLAVGCDAATP
jgi:serine/threonine-protein kinase RsbW